MYVSNFFPSFFLKNRIEPHLVDNCLFFYLQIGSSLQRMSQSPVNLNQVAKPSIKEGIMDAIKIGVPGVFNLPQMKSGSNDSHIRWTLIGLEDQLWGKSVALSGR